MQKVAIGTGIDVALGYAKDKQWSFVRVTSKNQQGEICHEQLEKVESIEWHYLLSSLRPSAKEHDENHVDIVINKKNEIEVFPMGKYAITIRPLTTEEIYAMVLRTSPEKTAIFKVNHQKTTLLFSPLEEMLAKWNRSRMFLGLTTLHVHDMFFLFEKYLIPFSVNYINNYQKIQQTVYYISNVDLLLRYVEKEIEKLTMTKGRFKVTLQEAKEARLPLVEGPTETTSISLTLNNADEIHISFGNHIRVLSLKNLPERSRWFLLGKSKEQLDPSPLPIHQVMTCSEVDTMWGLPKGTTKRDCNRNRFNPYKVRKSGRTWLIEKEEAERVYGNIK